MKKHLTFISYYRKEKNFTQEEMADALGISQRHYSRIENGKTPITLKHLRVISRLLNVSITELIGETELQSKSSSIENNERILYNKLLEKQKEENTYLKSLVEFIKRSQGK